MLTLVIGVATAFSVHMVGSLYISEIIFLPLLPILILVHPRRIFRPGLRIVLALLTLWLFGQVMTDLYRSTEMADWLREYANIVFFAINLLSLAVLLGKSERRKAIFIGGLAFGSLLAVRYQPSIWLEGDPWKFGYSFGTNIAVALLSAYFYKRRQYLVVGALLGGVMVINLVENYRSPVLTLLVTIALILPVIPEQVGRFRLLPRAGSVSRVVVLAGIAASAGLAASFLVHFATSEGYISADAQAKNQSESQSSIGLLLAGRPEILVSARAVWDSPILGHGSAGRDYKYIEMLNDLEAKTGTPIDLEDLEEEKGGLIPTHSHLMNAWVKAGILGGVFWLYILWLAFGALIQVAIRRPPLAPIYTFMLVTLLWDIPFSPFGGGRRALVALMIMVSLDLLDPVMAHRKELRQQHKTKWRRQIPLRGRPDFLPHPDVGHSPRGIPPNSMTG